MSCVPILAVEDSRVQQKSSNSPSISRQLAMDLTYNNYLKNEVQDTSRTTQKRKRYHNLFTALPHTQIYNNKKWCQKASQKYQKYMCQGEGCKKKSELTAVALLEDGCVNPALRHTLLMLLQARKVRSELSLPSLSMNGVSLDNF